MKRLSIIIPVYNTQDYLADAVSSVAGRYEDIIEILLIDDGSTDNSGAICDKYAKEYKNIRTIHQKNQGLSMTRNIGIKKAHGEYVSFLDSDDMLVPESLKKILEITDSGVDLIVGNYKKFQSIHEIKNISEDFIGIPARNDLLSEIINGGGLLGLSSVIIKRKLFIKNDIYNDIKLASLEDIDCALKLILKAKHATWLEPEHYLYRQGRAESLTNAATISRIKIEGFFIFLDRWVKKAESIDNKNAQESLLNFLAYQYAILLGKINLLSNNLRSRYINKAKKYQWLLGRATTRKTKVVRMLVRLLGVRLSSKILGIFLRAKS